MRINKIVLKNYRQYKDVKIEFNRNKERDLHTFIGMGGTGKTNMLNAINWCLYGDEPHLSLESQQLPRLHIATPGDLQPGNRAKVRVEIWTESTQTKILFIREEHYMIHENKQIAVQEINFEVGVRDHKGNSKMFSGDEADLYVERFVPKRIREFFFFDVEKLDGYFKGATGPRIESSIFQISQITLLRRIEKRLDAIISDLTYKATKQNPNLASIGKDLEIAKENLDETITQRLQCEEQIVISKEKIEECQERLKGYPDTEKLQSQIENLQKNRKKIETILIEKVQDKEGLLFEYGKFMMLYPYIEQSIEIIEDKRQKKEIPPLVEPTTLEKILQDKYCGICGRDFEINSREAKYVEDLLEGIRISSDINKEIFKMESPLYVFKDKAKHFLTTMKSISRDIDHHEKEFEENERKIRDIDLQLAVCDPEKIGNWQQDRIKWERLHDTNQQIVGVKKDYEQKFQKIIEQLEKELSQGLRKVVEHQETNKQIDFSKKALSIAKESSIAVMEIIREQIERETAQQFFKLIWKKGAFKDVTIDKSYNLHVIHSEGYECLGSLSASERELLTLSFIFALHKISGFQSLLLVDTPVARVSDKQRENFAKVFTEIDPNKQAILLFTPSEYSEEVSKYFDEATSNKFQLTPSSELETELEVM